MNLLSPRSRWLIAGGGVIVSFVIWVTLELVARNGRVPTVVQTATIDQYRTNLTASTTGGEPQTFATVKVDFPATMSLQSSREIVVEYARYFAAGGSGLKLEQGQLVPDLAPPRPGAMFERLRRSLSARLDASAFDTSKPEVVVAEESPLPCKLRWIVTPKKAGRHLALLDLRDMISPSTDPTLFGTTTVTLGGRPAALDQGTQLPLAIEVIDDEAQFAWVWKTLGSVPALAGFVLTYPLVVDWLKRRLRRAKKNRADPPATPDPAAEV